MGEIIALFSSFLKEILKKILLVGWIERHSSSSVALVIEFCLKCAPFLELCYHVHFCHVELNKDNIVFPFWLLSLILFIRIDLQAESLVKFQQDMGETMGELGLAFVKLTKFETEEAIFESQRVRAADMRNVATASVKASRLYRELNTQTIKHLASTHILMTYDRTFKLVYKSMVESLMMIDALTSWYIP